MKYISSLFSCILLLVFVSVCTNNLYSSNAHNMVVKIVSLDENEVIEEAEVYDVVSKKKYNTSSDGIVTIATVHNQKVHLRIRKNEFQRKDTTFQENDQDTILIQLSKVSHTIADDIVVTATRSSTSKQESPVRIAVIDQKQLQQTQSVTLAEGLQYQQGLRLENNCQNCGTTQIRINGLEGPYSQILIDSKPIFSTVSGVYGLEQIPSTMIQSIEVLRGGASSMYGGNAVGGVINVLTKEPLMNEFDVSSTGTSFGNGVFELTNQAFGTVVSDDLTNGATVYGTFRTRNPFDANGDGFSEIARLDQKTIGTKLFSNLTDNVQLKLGYSFIHEDRRGGNKFELLPEESDITEWIASKTHLGSISLDYEVDPTIKLGIYSGMSAVDRKSYYGANQDSNSYGTTSNGMFLLGTTLIKELNTDNFGEHLITTGAEFQYEGLEDIALGYNRNIRQFVRQQGFYIQDNVQFHPTVDAIVGIRLDRHSMVNNLIVNPRLSVKYSPIPAISIRGNYSTGYRAPQAFNEDLHIQVVNGDLQIHLPGTNLREERSQSFSTSVEYRYQSNDISFNSSIEGFSTNLNGVFAYNFIGKDQLGNQIFERMNGGTSFVRGLTFDFTSTIGRLVSMRGSFTVQENVFEEAYIWSERIVDENSQNPVLIQQSTTSYLRTPNQYGFFSITAGPFSNILTSISAVYTGSMMVPWYQTETDILYKTPNFFDVMVKSEYTPQFFNGLSVSVGMFNIFNSYQPIFDSGVNRDAGFTFGPLKPRSVFLGIRYSL
jgi:outer membrane receptor for ferrienterochelin and colicins